MSLWGFRFLLWYVCILLVQPQNRFTFLWPLRIANLSFIIATCLHVLSCMDGRRAPLRMGPATILALALIVFSIVSLHFGVYQVSSAWNPSIDTLVKSALLVIMVEAMATSVERVWALQMTVLFSTLWWVKGGLRLSHTGATYAGDRLMGAAVSIIDNPNSFAYMMCIFLPLYLYAYQQATRRWIKWFFLVCALAAVYIVFQTGSRTGLVTLIAMGVFLVPFYGRNHLRTLAVAVVVLVLIYPLSGEKNMARFRTIPQSIAAFLGKGEEQLGPMTQDEQSAAERQAKNRDTWALIKENLILGVGISPQQSLFTDRFPMASGQVHCEILFAGKQMGIFGMGIYAGFLAVVFFGGWWVYRTTAHWPAVRDLGWTFQLQAVAILVGGSFNPTVWHPAMMLLVGSSSALVGALRAERRAAGGTFP